MAGCMQAGGLVAVLSQQCSANALFEGIPHLGFMAMTDAEMTAEMAMRTLISVAQANPHCGSAILASLLTMPTRTRQEEVTKAAVLTTLLDATPALQERVEATLRDQMRTVADGMTRRVKGLTFRDGDQDRG